MLIVCLARRTSSNAAALGEGQAAFGRIELKPLSRRSSRDLVEEILKKAESVPEALQHMVVEGAEGNPYYMEELVKMLIEEGVIQRENGRWWVESEKLATVHVPATLTGLLQARLDGLPKPERELLQMAAVVGRQFWDATVADLMGQPQEEIEPLLSSIRERELIFRRERSAFAGTEEYIFKHALLRDVVYETVLLKLRREFHSRVAGWLERRMLQRKLRVPGSDRRTLRPGGRDPTRGRLSRTGR
jgi:predicted ATPase